MKLLNLLRAGLLDRRSNWGLSLCFANKKSGPEPEARAKQEAGKANGATVVFPANESLSAPSTRHKLLCVSV